MNIPSIETLLKKKLPPISRKSSINNKILPRPSTCDRKKTKSPSITRPLSYDNSSKITYSINSLDITEIPIPVNSPPNINNIPITVNSPTNIDTVNTPRRYSMPILNNIIISPQRRKSTPYRNINNTYDNIPSPTTKYKSFIRSPNRIRKIEKLVKTSPSRNHNLSKRRNSISEPTTPINTLPSRNHNLSKRRKSISEPTTPINNDTTYKSKSTPVTPFMSRRNSIENNTDYFQKTIDDIEDNDAVKIYDIDMIKLINKRYSEDILSSPSSPSSL